MSTEQDGDILYTELWSPKDAWLELPTEEREAYFEQVSEGIETLLAEGVEIIGWAVVEGDGPHSTDHDYMAVWRMPSETHVEMLEGAVEEAGWHDYFDQVNAEGEFVPPEVALEHMAVR